MHTVIEPADPAAPPPAKEGISYARSRLASYKAPKTIEPVDAIQRSTATKVSRSWLTEMRGGREGERPAQLTESLMCHTGE